MRNDRQGPHQAHREQGPAGVPAAPLAARPLRGGNIRTCAGGSRSG